MDTNHAEWIREALDRHQGGMVGYAMKFLNGDADRARDVVQDTFLKLIRADRKEVEDHLAEWLFTVCRNRCLDVLRKERRMKTLTEDRQELLESPGITQNSSIEKEETHKDVLSLLDGLPERQQEVIRLKFLGGLSYKEISRVTELTVSNVGFLIHTGLKTIRIRVESSTTSETRTNLGIAR